MGQLAFLRLFILVAISLDRASTASFAEMQGRPQCFPGVFIRNNETIIKK